MATLLHMTTLELIFHEVFSAVVLIEGLGVLYYWRLSTKFFQNNRLFTPLLMFPPLFSVLVMIFAGVKKGVPGMMFLTRKH
jgi:hypothetical protein